ELGAGPAFPCNVGVNEVAAHYTSPWKDESMIPDDSLVKIDFGVELDGYITIRNLTGHKIERYRIHAGKSVPNVSGIESGRFEVGEVYAVEPFVTRKDADGAVEETDEAFIYRFVRAKGAKSKTALALADDLQRNYKTMPFAARWVFDSGGSESESESESKSAFEELIANRCVVGYPVLVEISGSVVVQAEHTLVVTPDGCRVLTA